MCGEPWANGSPACSGMQASMKSLEAWIVRWWPGHPNTKGRRFSARQLVAAAERSMYSCKFVNEISSNRIHRNDLGRLMTAFRSQIPLSVALWDCNASDQYLCFGEDYQPTLPFSNNNGNLSTSFRVCRASEAHGVKYRGINLLDRSQQRTADLITP